MHTMSTWFWHKTECDKIEEELWSASERCSALELREAIRSFVMVHHLKDLSFIPVSSKGCKLQCRDSRLLSARFSALIFRLLTLHRHHHRETELDKMQ
jgi:hypothetical protein